MTSPNVPPRGFMRLQWKVHKFVWRLSGGRLGRKSGGMPVLELTTTGHKSGRPRTVLIWYVDHDGSPVIAGTNAGADYDPAWVKNLRANPAATVTVDGERFAALARFVEAPEHDEVWSRFKAENASYGNYEAGLTRRVPLVLLTRS